LDAGHRSVQRGGVREGADDLLGEARIGHAVEAADGVASVCQLGDDGAADAARGARHENASCCHFLGCRLLNSARRVPASPPTARERAERFIASGCSLPLGYWKTIMT